VLFRRFNPYKELLKASDRVEKAYNLLIGASMLESSSSTSAKVKTSIGPMLKSLSGKHGISKMIVKLRTIAFKELTKSISIIEKILRRKDYRVDVVREDLENILNELRKLVELGYTNGVEGKIRSIADRIHRVEDVLWRMNR